MNLLIDTHIFIWWDSDPDLLPPMVRDLLEDTDNTMLLSLASIWEMQIKNQLGKLTFSRPLPDIIESQQKTNGLKILPIELKHIYGLSSLPDHHKDLFDRLLIAQAKIEDIAVVSVDSVFPLYPVKVMGGS